MIPELDQYLSFLMAAPRVLDADLESLGVDVLERFGSGVRGLLVRAESLERYRDLVRERLEPGYWNDLVGREQVFFIFKLPDGSIEEFTLSESNRGEIARLCSQLNGDPLEKTSDLFRYFATNPFYRAVMVECYGVAPRA
jgi:hypothetical protein